MVEIDLATKMGPITFPNPVLPGSSEIACNTQTVKRCIESGVGGIVTKSYTNVPEMAARARPYNFFYQKFGSGLEYTWYSVVRADTVLADTAVQKLIPEMVKLCKKAEIPFIGNILELPDPERWVKVARKFDEAGVDGLELNLGCPQVDFVKGKIPIGKTIGENLKVAREIIRAVKEEVSIPIWVKMSPQVNPVEEYALEYTEAGGDALSAHNTLLGFIVDLETETPFGAPFVCGFLAGRAYVPISLARIVQMRRVLPNIPISGIGGIFGPFDTLQYLLVGCETAQVCSGIYERGYGLFREIIDGIKAWMNDKGYTNIEQFRGKAFKLVGEPKPETYPTPTLGPEERPSPYVPIVDQDICRAKECNICEKICLYNAIEVDMKKGEVKLDYDKCWSCGSCIGLCPETAMKLVDRETQSHVVWANRGLAETLMPE